MLSASSYGHFTEAKEFWSQCHISRFGSNRRCQRYAKQFAKALSENALPAEFQISKFYIPRKRLEKVPREKKNVIKKIVVTLT